MQIFRKFFWRLCKWFLFRLDAETAHHLGARLIQGSQILGGMPMRILCGAPPKAEASRVQVFGLDFLSRVGLAAGFDKNADLVEALPKLGFGFVEIGTVTLRPQPGNPRPRLFRDPDRSLLFNRMGFNSLGATLVSEQLGRKKHKLPSHFRVGVNLGKNKETSNEEAKNDYVQAAKFFEGLADYVVINVSSPNTPGLRSLQTVEALKPIVDGVKNELLKWKTLPPLLLKIAPELSNLELTHLIQNLEPMGIDGWVLTNTLAGEYKSSGQTLTGGWSGKVLSEISRKSLIEARNVSQKPIISVGGIHSPDEALSRISEGASLIQVYTGWVYGGPSFPRELSQRILPL